MCNFLSKSEDVPFQPLGDLTRNESITYVLCLHGYTWKSLNTGTPTRVPNTVFQQTSSPGITTVSNTLYNRTSWQTHHALSSDHLPIMTTINILQANWTQFTKDPELSFSQTTIPDDIHTANRILTNIILLADKHNIPKGKIPNTSRLLPEHIVYKITKRDNIRRANPCDPALKPLNLEITSDISFYKQNLWKEHFNANWDHRHNTHTLWKTKSQRGSTKWHPLLELSL